MKTMYDLLEPGGIGVISTPYHGYIKNLLIALTGKYDRHWSPLWDGGHIKFWSQKTLGRLFEETGFSVLEYIRVGRLPVIAKSIIAVVRKDGKVTRSVRAAARQDLQLNADDG
jgi:2-polyprenyl-6-hydroxyphenyl methylase/3-demethylubiquinone-9 3-methyltransferase